jgi:hypothetical protein
MQLHSIASCSCGREPHLGLSRSAWRGLCSRRSHSRDGGRLDDRPEIEGKDGVVKVRSDLPLRRSDVAFRYFDAVGPSHTLFSWLNRTARTLAIYASRLRSPVMLHGRARLASGRWSSCPGGIRTRWVPSRSFSVVLYVASFSPRLCLAHRKA